jgi:hypothetical protein
MNELTPKKFIIEGLPQLDIANDPLAWARAPRLRDEWIRRLAPDFNISTDKYIRGKLLGGITGDDEGSFGLKSIGFIPDFAHIYGPSILERLRYEIASPELPEIIRSRLVQVEEALRGIKLNTQAGYDAGRDLWTNQARNFTREQLLLHPEFQEDLNYVLGNGQDLESFIQERFFKPANDELVSE